MLRPHKVVGPRKEFHMFKKRILGGLAAAGLAATALLAAPTAQASTSSQAAPGGQITHHRNSALAHLGVMNHWPYRYATYQTSYANLKAAGGQPWMLARGDRTAYWSDVDGFWCPPGYWAGEVTGVLSNQVRWLTNGGSVGRAYKVNSLFRGTVILCRADQDGNMCLNKLTQD